MFIQDMYMAKRKIFTAQGLRGSCIRQISYLWNSHIVLNGQEITFQYQNYKQINCSTPSFFVKVFSDILCLLIFVFHQEIVSDLIMKESEKPEFILQKFTESRKEVKRNSWKVVSISNSPVAKESVYSKSCPFGKLMQ